MPRSIIDSLIRDRVEKQRRNLQKIPYSDRINYSNILIGLGDFFSRILSLTLGIGKHPCYFSPLWDPREYIKQTESGEISQFVGFEYFDINSYIPNLIDISHITFALEIDIIRTEDEWFLDFTNIEGESLVTHSENLKAFNLFVNDALVDYAQLPLFYNSIRSREYYWSWYEYNKTSHNEITEFLKKRKCKMKQESRLGIYCEELGLIINGELTVSGKSLIGKRERRMQYEFPYFK